MVLTFLIARVIPGDPAVTYAGPRASAAQLGQARTSSASTSPCPRRSSTTCRGSPTGDWGVSYHTKQPVLSDLAHGAPASVELVVAALLILALALGIPLGLLSARWKGRAPDLLVRLVSVVGVSMPVFWLALILQLVFFQKLGWLPVAGQYDPNLDYTSPLAQPHAHAWSSTRSPTGNWPVFWSAVSASGAAGGRRRRRTRSASSRGWCARRCSRRSARTTCDGAGARLPGARHLLAASR